MMELLKSFEPLILTLHFIVCLFLTVVILLQAGKGASMGAAFGAGSSQTLFGARGAATFLSKMTTIAAVFFLFTSISLTAIHKQRSAFQPTESALEEEAQPAETPNTLPEVPPAAKPPVESQ